jgi:hypothetical protein
MVALLAGANYALPGGYPREPIRFVVALLGVAALAAVLATALRALRQGANPVTRAYACYWAASTLLLGSTFVLTTNARALGAGSVNYLLPFALAAGAGVGMLAVTRRAQLVAALAITFVAVANTVSIAQGRSDTPPSALASSASRVVRLLQAHGATYGYAVTGTLRT